ncbi:MAG: NAD-dependent epimerase/dehydratase family protein [Hyphomicrobium sp.]
MKGTVLVTGASGFIGRDLIRRLAGDGWRVRAAARGVAEGLSGRGIEACMLPDLKKIVWRPLLSGVTHVVHLAGIAHSEAAISEETYMEVNAHSVRRLAEAARSAGVKRIVLMSSIRAQTGPTSDRIVTESDTPEPTDAYGRSKLAAERALAEVLAGSGTEWTALRPVLVYGAGVKGNMKRLIELARTPWPLPFANFDNRRSIVSVANVSGAVAHALVEPRCAGGVFLVADEQPVSVADIVRSLRQGEGRAPRLLPIPKAPLGAALRLAGKSAAWKRLTGDLVADTSSLRATGWTPAPSTYAALAKTAALPMPAAKRP